MQSAATGCGPPQTWQNIYECVVPLSSQPFSSPFDRTICFPPRVPDPCAWCTARCKNNLPAPTCADAGARRRRDPVSVTDEVTGSCCLGIRAASCRQLSTPRSCANQGQTGAAAPNRPNVQNLDTYVRTSSSGQCDRCDRTHHRFLSRIRIIASHR